MDLCQNKRWSCSISRIPLHHHAIMEHHPLTPPREHDTHAASETQADEDTNFLQKWFQCRSIDIDTILNDHNRTTIPIEENIIFMNRLKDALDASSTFNSTDEKIDYFLRSFKEEAELLKRKASDATLKYYMMDMPAIVRPSFLGFLRSRSKNSANSMICRVIPSLFDRIHNLEASQHSECRNPETEQQGSVERHHSSEDTAWETSLRKARKRSQKPNTFNNSRARSSIVKKTSPKRKPEGRNTVGIRRSLRLQSRHAGSKCEE